MSIDDWLDEHFDEDEEVHTFDPKDLYFQIVTREIPDYDVLEVAITPAKYFDEEGYLFDQHFLINGLDWNCSQEGVFVCPDDLRDKVREYLSDLGMVEKEGLWDE